MLKLHVKVSVTDDEFIVDWSGSHPATPGPMNLPIGLTEGVSALAFKGVTTPDTPANSGNYRPLTVIAPPGEMMHAIPPAPTFTVWAALLAPEVILKALSQGLPERIPACSGGDVFSVVGVGVLPETGEVWLEGSNEAVGFGAFAGSDGEDAIMHLSEPGCRNNPVEVVESKAPWIIETYHMRQDSGGPGKYRGGVGVRRSYRFLQPATTLTLVKKTKSAPWGMAGGHDADAGHVVVWPGTDREERTGAIHYPVDAEDVLAEQLGRRRRLGQSPRTRPSAGAGRRHQRFRLPRIRPARLWRGHRRAVHARRRGSDGRPAFLSESAAWQRQGPTVLTGPHRL